jgi:hypothetical protein
MSWLKASLERDARFGQFLIVNDDMPLRLQDAKILSSNTLNSLDSIVNRPHFRPIAGSVGTPLMDNQETVAEGRIGYDTVKQGQSWMVNFWRLDVHSF